MADNNSYPINSMSIGKAQSLGDDRVKEILADNAKIALNSMSIEKAQSMGTQKVNDLLQLGNIDKKDDKTGKTIETAKKIENTITATSDLISKYGIRQEIIIKQAKEDANVSISRKLNDNCKPKEEIQVECLGDTMYKVGYGVHVILPFLPTYEDCLMFIKQIINEWKDNGTFISTLTLTPSRVMDEQEWSDDPQDDTTGGSGGTELANKIIAVLKQQLGKPYVWGAKGPDTFDCSGLVYYCYNQFKDELGITMGGSTYEQVKQGTEVDKNDKSAWQPADLLFWTGKGDHAPPSHVTVYLGNNQMIQAPQTGDVVKISEVSRTDIYAVRRVVPEDTSTSSTDSSNVDLTNATKINMSLSFYTGEASEGGNESASGKTLQYGMCASNYYPFGTKFYIKNINGLSGGIFTVEDTGSDPGFKTPNRLDIYVGNSNEAIAKANNLGRQNCVAYKLNS